jgi:hypothetical protein
MTVCRSLLARAAALGVAAALFLAAAAPALAAVPPPPGGPILVVTSSADGFGGYLPEILRQEGLNEFDVADVGSLGPQLLAGHGVVVLGPTGLSAGQVATLSAWVQGGGDLIALRPSASLAPLLGLSGPGGTISNGSITATAQSGVTTSSMQFHGDGDVYALAGAGALATYSGSSAPAVSLRAYGAGQAAAFTYDLGRSVVYTRQGNPAWAGQERDNADLAPPQVLRSDDLFFSDWVDLGRVQVPSADEQQRLLANLVIGMRLPQMPLPRFWYLPFGLKAAVVMTGDDHAKGPTGDGTEGTVGQFVRERDEPDRPELPQRGEPHRPGGRPLAAARPVPLELPEHRRAGDQPQSLHRVERLGRRAARRAGTGHPLRHELLLLARRMVEQPPRAVHRLWLPDALRQRRRLARRRLPGRVAAHRRVRGGHPDAHRDAAR